MGLKRSQCKFDATVLEENDHNVKCDGCQLTFGKHTFENLF